MKFARSMQCRTRALLMLICAAGAPLACKKPQSFEDAIRLACEYPERPDVVARLAKMPPNESAMALTKEVMALVENPEAQSLFKSVPPSKEARDAAFRSAVKRAGLARCWITDPPPASSAATAP